MIAADNHAADEPDEPDDSFHRFLMDFVSITNEAAGQKRQATRSARRDWDTPVGNTRLSDSDPLGNTMEHALLSRGCADFTNRTAVIVPDAYMFAKITLSQSEPRLKSSTYVNDEHVIIYYLSDPQLRDMWEWAEQHGSQIRLATEADGFDNLFRPLIIESVC